MAQNLIGALKAGSGIDVGALARDLVEASRGPQKSRIDEKIAKAEARISGYSVVQFGLTEIRKAFDALKNAQTINAPAVTNARTDAATVTATSAAPLGSFQFEVLSVVSAQRSLSNGFAARDTTLGASPISLTIQLAGVSTPVQVADPTPEGIVRAVNDANAGVTATLVEAGGAQPIRILLSGPAGAGQDFSLSSDLAAGVLDFGTPLSAATDARVRIDGIEYQRQTNRIDDVFEGVTLDLKAQTASAGTVSVARDTTQLAERIRALAVAYQDFADSLDVLVDRDSEVEEFGGALAGESLVRQLRTQVEGFLRAPGSADAVSTSRDFGLAVAGRVTLDETALKNALDRDPEAVVRFFTADAPGAGRAEQSVASLDAMLNPRTGVIAQQKTNSGARVGVYTQQLMRLETQMESLLARYTRQFSLMEAIVGDSNSLRASLEGTFEGLAAMYTRR